MVVGAKYKVTVGEVEQAHGEEVSKLIQELVTAGGPARRHAMYVCGVPFDCLLANGNEHTTSCH